MSIKLSDEEIDAECNRLKEEIGFIDTLRSRSRFASGWVPESLKEKIKEGCYAAASRGDNKFVKWFFWWQLGYKVHFDYYEELGFDVYVHTGSGFWPFVYKEFVLEW